MKKSLFLVLAGLVLTGCVAPVNESDSTDLTESVTDDSSGWYPGVDGPGYNCVPQYIKIEFQGQTHILTIPSLCDERPYMDVGDPPPDADHREEITNPGSNPEMMKRVEKAPVTE